MKDRYILVKVPYGKEGDCHYCTYHSSRYHSNDMCNNCTADPPSYPGQRDNFKRADEFEVRDVVEDQNRIIELECEVYELTLHYKEVIKYKNDLIEDLIIELKEGI